MSELNDDFNVMKHFMMEIDLPSNPPSEFFMLIPEQRNQVLELMEDGVILSYGLSEDRTKLWVVMLANSVTEAHKLAEKFPLFKYMTISIQRLLFFNNSKHKLPELSLN